MGPAGLNPDIRQSERYFDKASKNVITKLKAKSDKGIRY
jgi:hypothetical protein